MKKRTLIVLIGFIPSMSFTMEEKPVPCTVEEGKLSKEDADLLWWQTAFPLSKYGTESLPYAQYRENMKKAVLAGSLVQDHKHNPLVMTIHAKDYELTKLLLERGASPTFRGINMISGFDALRLRRGSNQIDNPALIKELRALLEKFQKEEITRYPLAGMNASYINDAELERFRQKNNIDAQSMVVDDLVEMIEKLAIEDKKIKKQNKKEKKKN